MPKREKLQEEVDRNYAAFVKEVPSLLPAHRGKFALMREGKVVEFFDTARDAHVAGRELFKEDGLYSVQEVTETPVDLGFFSHAVSQRAVDPAVGPLLNLGIGKAGSIAAAIGGGVVLPRPGRHLS